MCNQTGFLSAAWCLVPADLPSPSPSGRSAPILNKKHPHTAPRVNPPCSNHSWANKSSNVYNLYQGTTPLAPGWLLDTVPSSRGRMTLSALSPKGAKTCKISANTASLQRPPPQATAAGKGLTRALSPEEARRRQTLPYFTVHSRRLQCAGSRHTSKLKNTSRAKRDTAPSV